MKRIILLFLLLACTTVVQAQETTTNLLMTERTDAFTGITNYFCHISQPIIGFKIFVSTSNATNDSRITFSFVHNTNQSGLGLQWNETNQYVLALIDGTQRQTIGISPRFSEVYSFRNGIESISWHALPFYVNQIVVRESIQFRVTGGTIFSITGTDYNNCINYLKTNNPRVR